MEQGIVYIVMGLVCVVAFMVGKYVLPNAGNSKQGAEPVERLPAVDAVGVKRL